MITRRAVLLSAAALSFAAIVGATALVPQAQAQVDAAELVQPGPLGDMAQGAANAPVTIVEYASMTCSHCATFHIQTYPQLKTKLIDTGKVRYILREFPLDDLARGAFMLARCGGDKYFEIVDALFKQQKAWAFVQNPVPQLFAIVRPFGFNEQSFEKCVSDQKVLDGISEVARRGAEKFKVNSTPTFFINGKVFRGALTIDQIEREVAPLLKGS